MKKKIIWPVAGAAVAAVIIGIGTQSQTPEVDCFVAQAQTVYHTIECEGKVEEAGQTPITLGKAVIPEKILVKKGDKVWKGRVLMEYVEPSLLDSISDADEEVLEAFQAFQSSGLGAMAAGAGALSSDASNMEELLTQPAQTLIAPASGIVTEISVRPNVKSGGGETVMTIASSDRLQVKLDISETKISQIELGQKVRISGVGFRNSTYYGVVTDIGSRAKTSALTGGTPSVAVCVTLLKKGEDIKPGFSAKARILTGEQNDTIVVPYEAVGADRNGREYVYVVKNSVAQKTYVTTAGEHSEGFEVIGGIQQGDQIVGNAAGVSNGKRVIISGSQTKTGEREND